MDAPRLRSNRAAAGPERALRKEVTALADRLKALTAEEERAHAATLARFDDTDDDEDDGAVPPPPPPPPAPPAPPPPLVESTAAAADVARPRARARSARTRLGCLGAEARLSEGAARSSRCRSWPPCTTRAPRACRARAPRRRPAAHVQRRKRFPRRDPPGAPRRPEGAARARSRAGRGPRRRRPDAFHEGKTTPT